MSIRRMISLLSIFFLLVVIIGEFLLKFYIVFCVGICLGILLCCMGYFCIEELIKFGIFLK